MLRTPDTLAKSSAADTEQAQVPPAFQRSDETSLYHNIDSGSVAIIEALSSAVERSGLCCECSV